MADVPIGDLPSIVGGFLGVGPTVGGIILSGLILFGILIALSILDVGILGEAIGGIAFLSIFTFLGWFPIWLMLIVAFITAVLVANQVSQTAKGGTD